MADLNWWQIGDQITFPANLGLTGFAASSHGDPPVKFLFGVKLGALGSMPNPYERTPAMFKIGDATGISFYDITRQ